MASCVFYVYYIWEAVSVFSSLLVSASHLPIDLVRAPSLLISPLRMVPAKKQWLHVLRVSFLFCLQFARGVALWLYARGV